MSGRCGGAVISAVPLIWNGPLLAAAAVGVARLIVRLLSSGGASPEKDGRELLRSSPVDLVPLPVAPAKRVPPRPRSSDPSERIERGGEEEE